MPIPFRCISLGWNPTNYPAIIPDEYQGISYVDANNERNFRELLIKAVRVEVHEAESQVLLGEDQVA